MTSSLKPDQHSEPSLPDAIDPLPPASTTVNGTPSHVAIIMDGNGRWAEARKKTRPEGHRAGHENVRRVVAAATELGVKYLTLFAFSTENWNRPHDEISGILGLAAEVIKVETEELHRNNVRVRHIGRLDRLPEELGSRITDAEVLTRENTGLNLSVAFDYGGRYDIVQAVKRLVANGVLPENVDETLIARHLFTSEIPDPDLIIRTGGEFRISNFLLWQSAYAEFYSAGVFWPDFDKRQLEQALAAYSARERRFGKVRQD